MSAVLETDSRFGEHYRPVRDEIPGLSGMLQRAAERGKLPQHSPFDQVVFHLSEHNGQASIEELAQASHLDPERIKKMGSFLTGVFEVHEDIIICPWLVEPEALVTSSSPAGRIVEPVRQP